MRINLPDCHIEYSRLYAFAKAETLYDQLYQDIPWESHQVRVFNKWYDQPRLTAVYADAQVNYGYSGLKMNSQGWTDSLLQIKTDVEEVTGKRYNLCLCNLYRDGNDSNGWHADDEKVLGTNPVIASVSLGATRRFKLKHKQDPTQKLDLDLESGSLLYMAGETQHTYKHQIPKTARKVEPRINLTFRYVHG